MIFNYNDKEYEVEIIRKKNKNTYVRVRDNKIYVTTSYFVSNGKIKRILEENRCEIGNMIDRAKVREHKKELFIVFGKYYNVIYGDFDRDLILEEDTIKVKNQEVLYKWKDNLVKSTFYNRLMSKFDDFEEDIPIPTLKIKPMKSRWGVCNTKTKCITLNLDLFRYDIKCLDYVAVHELAHFLEPNHSKAFWSIVEKYCPDYKEIKKILKG